MGMLRDFWHIEEFMPTSIKIYENKEEGISKGEIISPKSKYGAEKVRWFDDEKRGIHLLDIGENKQIENKEPIRIVKPEALDYDEEEMECQ